MYDLTVRWFTIELMHVSIPLSGPGFCSCCLPLERVHVRAFLKLLPLILDYKQGGEIVSDRIDTQSNMGVRLLLMYGHAHHQ